MSITLLYTPETNEKKKDLKKSYRIWPLESLLPGIQDSLILIILYYLFIAID